MEESIERLKDSYPGRELQISQLLELFGGPKDPHPKSLYICGGPSTGKSSIVTGFLKCMNIKHGIVNLIECYTSKILFETILNQLTEHRIDPKVGAPFAKCDNLMEFIEQLIIICDSYGLNGSVIVIDKAEELRNMEFNLLPAFLSLQDLSGTPISVILLSDIPFEKYYDKLNIVEPIKMHFPQYDKDQLLEILSLDLDSMKKLICSKYSLNSIDIDLDFYRNYLNIFLAFFYRACRDLSELRHISKSNFLLYFEPIYKRELTIMDSMALWKRISPAFSASAEVLYLRLTQDSHTNKPLTNKLSQTLELPYYAKYLLIAAYLASYNTPKDDKRLFMKFHGKKRKTKKDVQTKSKVAEQLNTQIGPKPFTLDRLLAIFYSILEDKVGFNNHLLVQVSSLVELQLLSLVSDEANLDGRKYKCTVNFDGIQSVARMLGFNIRKYLSDFSHM